MGLMVLQDRIRRIAIYGALAVGLYTVENLLPTPLPWLRIGVANVAVVLALTDLGLTAAALVFLAKLILGSIITGRFLTPFFFFGAVGGVIALGAMLLVWVFGRKVVSVVGISVAGGVFHNIGQLLIARFALIQSPALWRLLPVFIVIGVGTGTGIGIVARLIQLRIKEYA
jgi:heptaprenyl diphosphate synthase